MSNYQRLISYIYTYESGLKGKNVGFAKLETRNSQCRLTVNVKKVFPGGSPLGVYLLSGDGEQRIGTLFSRNGSGEFRALLNAEQVEGSGRPLREFYGLSIHGTEKERHSYTTIWEDAAMSAAETAKKDLERAGRNQEESQSSQEECVSEKKAEQEEKREEPELKAEQEEREGPEPKAEQKEAGEPEPKEEQEEKREQEIKADQPKEREAESIRSTLLCQNSLPSEHTPSAALSKAEDRTAPRSASPRSRRRPDGGKSAREWAESLAAQNSLKQICSTDTFIQADDRTFIPLHDLDDGCSHQRMWARLRRKYPKILAFDHEPGCEILTIKPQDIGLLPREAWIFGNNSFLLHGYYSYRYLILARLENPDGEPKYLLGVPGHYCSNEKYMASMFGFPDFIMSKKQPSGDDCFGYWYTEVRVGD